MCGVMTADGPVYGSATVLAAGTAIPGLAASAGVDVEVDASPPRCLIRFSTPYPLVNGILSSPDFEIRQLDDTTLIAAEHVPVGFSGDARELAGPTLHAIRSQLEDGDQVELIEAVVADRPIRVVAARCWLRRRRVGALSGRDASGDHSGRSNWSPCGRGLRPSVNPGRLDDDAGARFDKVEPILRFLVLSRTRARERDIRLLGLYRRWAWTRAQSVCPPVPVNARRNSPGATSRSTPSTSFSSELRVAARNEVLSSPDCVASARPSCSISCVRPRSPEAGGQARSRRAPPIRIYDAHSRRRCTWQSERSRSPIAIRSGSSSSSESSNRLPYAPLQTRECASAGSQASMHPRSKVGQTAATSRSTSSSCCSMRRRWPGMSRRDRHLHRRDAGPRSSGCLGDLRGPATS